MNLKTIFHKPVALILHGHSIQGLRDNIDKFKDFDWHWGTMNRLEIAERILTPADIKLYFFIKYTIDYENKDFQGHLLRDSKKRGNSLSEFLHQCIEDEVERVYLFGADGYSDNEKPYCDEFKGKPEQITWHRKDCEEFNATFPKDTRKTEIINVSPNSHYNLNNVSYEAFLDNISNQK